MPIDDDEVKRVLSERGATRACHRCGKDEFAVIQHYSYYPLQDGVDLQQAIPEYAMPVALVGCLNCGALTSHALGVLGLLPKQGES